MQHRQCSRSLALNFLTSLLLILAAQTQVAAAVIATQDQGEIRLANDLLDIRLDETSGTIRSIIDRQSGRDLVSASEGSYRSLWALRLGRLWQADNPYADNNGLPPPSVEIERNGSEAALRLTWRGVHFWAADMHRPDAVVSVRIALRDGEQLSRWTLAADNLGGLRTTDVTFPLIAGVGRLGADGSDDILAVPDQGGRLLHDPISSRANYSALYPTAHMSMQFSAYYDSTGGFYFAVHDNSGQTKQLQWWSPSTPANSALWSAHHYFPDQPADALAIPHDVVVGTFRGAWPQAADLYKNWALEQEWVKQAAGKTLPAWFRVSSAGTSQCVYGCGFESTATFATVVEQQSGNLAAFGVPTLLFLSGYEKLGAWAYGDALPPYGGWPEFDAMVSGLHKEQVRLRVNIGFNKLDLATPLGQSGTLADAYVRDPNGVAVRNETTISNRFHIHQIMSPASPSWKSNLIQTVTDLARHGTSVVMFDGWPIWGIDDDYSLGHPPGIGGNWQWQAWKNVLTDVEAAGRAVSPDILFSTEEGHELLLPFVHAIDKRDSSVEINEYSRTGTAVPIFAYVYKPYAQIGPGDYWPWIRAGEPDSYHLLVFARGLVWGEHPPFLYGSFRDTTQFSARALEFYRTVGRARRAFPQFLVDGAMLPPPVVDSPQTAVELRGDGYAVPGYKGNAGAVQVGAWKSLVGETGIVMANISGQKVDAKISVDFERLGLTPGTRYAVTIKSDRGNRSLGKISASTEISAALQANEIAMMLIRKPRPTTAAVNSLLLD